LKSDQINSIDDLLSVSQKLKDDYNFRGEKWWRGQEDQAWPLLASTWRSDKNRTDEYQRYIKFIAQAPSRHKSVPAKSDLSSWLFLMRHYGLKTRLLDWTRSPLYALYFAVKSKPSSDGSIFVLSPTRLNETNTKNRVIYTPDDLHSKQMIAMCFNPSPSLPDNSNKDAPQVIALVPDEIDIRLLVQLSVFTIQSSSVPLDKQADSEKYLEKYIIPAGSKKEIKSNLSDLGIRESILFPDLEHLSKDLN
jgi:hypothetical protein